MDESSNLSAPTHSPTQHNSSNEKVEDGPNTSTASDEKLPHHESQPVNASTSNGHTNGKSAHSIVPNHQNAKKLPPKTTADPHPKPKVPIRNVATLDSRKTSYPESATFKSTQELLKDEGALKWDRNAAQQLQEFMFQLTAQFLDHAKSASEHRESQSVNMEDVTEAIDSFNKTFKTDKVEIDKRLRDASERINSEPLPKIRSEVGIHAPNDRFMNLHPDYRYNDELQRQMEFHQPVVNNSLLGARPVHSNAYSSSIVEQTFNNPADANEYDY
ncbi:hypothetical protein M3Y97_00794300 [Aphelenchoides bicaudatus]|nr:hypothetical protein M3Y97_00794300 [Aphelenchoides bicaudatus]